MSKNIKTQIIKKIFCCFKKSIYICNLNYYGGEILFRAPQFVA